MRVASRKAPGRVDMPQYSLQAVFEALVNAVAHRDYSIRQSQIRLSMFADRLEIASPGNLPNTLSVDSMAERQATRNEVLASVLGRIPVPDSLDSANREYFLERRGDGVPIIYETTHELSGQQATYKLITDSELLLIIPAAKLKVDPGEVAVVIKCEQQPLCDVDVLVLFPNKTYKQSKTNADGIAYLELHTTHLPMTVFASSNGYSAGHNNDWIPASGPLTLELSPLPNGGSALFINGTGHLPVVSGRLNPILDNLNRSYLYADNIAINQGLQQPVNFGFNEDLHLTDANGREAVVRIIDIIGRSALLQYQAVGKFSAS